jgi:hypothetical protein
MAVRCFVIGYQDEAIDRSTAAPRLAMTARYFIYDDAGVGSGEVERAPVVLALTDAPVDQATKIRAAVFAHARDILQFPVGTLTASNVRIPATT